MERLLNESFELLIEFGYNPYAYYTPTKIANFILNTLAVKILEQP